MAKTKRKSLPKDFKEQLKACRFNELVAVFDKCVVNARGGYSKQTALAFVECPDDLTRWLVANGADLAAVDNFDDTPLHTRAGFRNGEIKLLLELGANVHVGEGRRGTPLHSVAGAFNVNAAKQLLLAGARVDALNGELRTPLEHSLQRCRNIEIEDMAELAQLLIAHGARITEDAKSSVSRIGQEFEFHRSNFNPEFLDSTEKGLQRLYQLFQVPPVPRRILYDGMSPIVASCKSWEDQHQEFWELLVPSSGAASTVQGEVIRISGRIHSELYRNGGIN